MTEIPEHWADLSSNQRAALLSLAELNEKERKWLIRKSKAGAFWSEFGERAAHFAERMKVPMTVIITIGAVIQFFGDGIAAMAEGFISVWRNR